MAAVHAGDGGAFGVLVDQMADIMRQGRGDQGRVTAGVSGGGRALQGVLQLAVLFAGVTGVAGAFQNLINRT